MPGTRAERRTEVRDRRRAARRHAMAVAASAVVAVGTVTGLVTAASGGGERSTARPVTGSSPALLPLPGTPSAKPLSPTATPSSSPSRASARPALPRLYHHSDSRVQEWVRAHRDDPRRPLIESRIAAEPAAVWFTEYNPGAITGQVREVTSAAAAVNRRSTPICG